MRPFVIARQITNRQTDSIDKYLIDVSKIPLITPEEEVELAIRIKEGDDVALQKLVKANLRFVVSVAKQYQHNHGLTLGDLINEGNLGLIKAAQRFDATRGFKFISYAVWWIRQSIIQGIGENSRVVRLPSNQVGTLNKINKTYSELEQKLERDPTVEELSDILNISSNEIIQAQRIGRKQISIDAPFESESDFNMLDVLEDKSIFSPDSLLINDSLKEDLRRAVNDLPPNLAIVITLYYGLNGTESMTLEQIGEIMDITTERVRQIKVQALKRLRVGSMKETFRSYI